MPPPPTLRQNSLTYATQVKLSAAHLFDIAHISTHQVENTDAYTFITPCAHATRETLNPALLSRFVLPPNPNFWPPLSENCRRACSRTCVQEVCGAHTYDTSYLNLCICLRFQQILQKY